MLILTLYLLATLIWGDRSTFRDYIREFIDFLTVVSFFGLTSELALTYHRFFRNTLFILCYWASFIAIPLFMYITSYKFTFPPQRLGWWGALRGPIWIGEIYGMMFIVLYFNHLNHKNVLRRIAYIFFSLIALMIVVLSQSRGPIYAMYISLLTASLLRRDKRLLIFLISIAAIVAYCLYARTEFIYNLIVERATSLRLDLIEASIPWIKQKMLIGHGILFNYSFIPPGGTNIDDPHNLYVETWLVGGIIGLSLLLALIAAALRQGYIYFRREKNITYLVLILYASICAFTDAAKIIDHPWPFYLYFWFPIALLSADELKPGNAIHEPVPGTKDE
jgi:O-antigen ligase